MNSLTVNLHLLLVSFYRPTSSRYKILTATTPFPSDRYAVASHVRLHGFTPEDAILEVPPPEEGEWADAIADILETHGEQIALVLIDGVNYYNGYYHDLRAIVDAGHKQGCLVGFDLAHAVGNLPLELHRWNVDFAAWCSYKYLNGGPGCTGGCFVHQRHHKSDYPQLAGWWGHSKERRFLMEPTFHPIMGAERWQLSNPAILPLAALRASMEIFDSVGMATLREKSVRLTAYLEFLLLESLGDKIEIITPTDPERRGCQLSIRLLGKGKSVFNRLTEEGVICDWREPDAIRVAPVPLYNSFLDVYRFVELLLPLI